MKPTKLTLQANAYAMKRPVLVACLFILCMSVFAQPKKNTTAPVKDPQDTFPVPAAYNQLFYLQRTANTNTVIYEANINSKGQLDEKNPVRVYWIRYPEGGMKKDLSYIQRVFAYGIKTEMQSPDVFNTHVVSYKKAQLIVKRSLKDGKYHAYATINHKEALLHRIFLKIDGGAFWSPNVIYIELKGRDETTGEEVMERFKPSQTP
jgi:hypothetical protein